MFNETSGESGSTENDWPTLGNSALVHFFKVFAHDLRGLNKQTTHANHIYLVLLGCAQNFIDRLLDSDVYSLETIVAQDDINKVLSNVVNITANGGQQNTTLAAVIGLFDKWFKVSYSSFHYLCRLQHERQLHFTLTKELTNNLHTLK